MKISNDNYRLSNENLIIVFKLYFRHSEKAFERFLNLLKTFDFENKSMIVDFRGDLKG